MAERLEVYKCDACGNIVEVLEGGGGELVCCGEPMKRMVENTVDAAKEKHVPVVEKTADGFKVKVGDVAHPMEEKHYIQWIEIIADGEAYRQFLKPGGAPEANIATASMRSCHSHSNSFCLAEADCGSGFPSNWGPPMGSLTLTTCSRSISRATASGHA